PVVGNCDVHRLVQLGTTSSLVDAPAEADANREAIVAGRVQVEGRPLSAVAAGRVLGARGFRVDPEVPVRGTERAWSARAARAPSIRGWRISSSDISQT